MGANQELQSALIPNSKRPRRTSQKCTDLTFPLRCSLMDVTPRSSPPPPRAAHASNLATPWLRRSHDRTDMSNNREIACSARAHLMREQTPHDSFVRPLICLCLAHRRNLQGDHLFIIECHVILSSLLGLPYRGECGKNNNVDADALGNVSPSIIHSSEALSSLFCVRFE